MNVDLKQYLVAYVPKYGQIQDFLNQITQQLKTDLEIIDIRQDSDGTWRVLYRY